MPSWPPSSSPQHQADPSTAIAQVERTAETSSHVSGMAPAVSTGVGEGWSAVSGCRCPAGPRRPSPAGQPPAPSMAQECRVPRSNRAAALRGAPGWHSAESPSAAGATAHDVRRAASGRPPSPPAIVVLHSPISSWAHLGGSPAGTSPTWVIFGPPSDGQRPTHCPVLVPAVLGWPAWWGRAVARQARVPVTVLALITVLPGPLLFSVAFGTRCWPRR